MPNVSGYLEIFEKGFGFLRQIENNFKPSNEDTYVPGPIIKQLRLREGLFIEGQAEENASQKNNQKLTNVLQINSVSAEAYRRVKGLKHQISINPDTQFKMTLNKRDRTGPILDLLVPIGRGQRGLIIAPPKTGKTSILKHIALAMEKNHPTIKVYVLLVDERPEEVTDFRRALAKTHVLASSADETVANHLRMTRLVMNTAMRETELGNDAVVLIDSLTRMGRAFNKDTFSHGRTLSGGLAANALDLPRRFFGAARNIENGGSLTIMATILIKTGSQMDEVIFQEFKGTGNLDLVLTQTCADQRVFPAINVRESGTRKEELLLDAEQLKKGAKLRRVVAQTDEVEGMRYLLESLPFQ